MTTSNDMLVLVPARGGSKRLPGKNLRCLGGLSLLAWTMASIVAAGLKSPLLSTDDESIVIEGQRLGYQVPFVRPSNLAADDATTLDVLLHALDWLFTTTGQQANTVLLLQPTSPFRPLTLIQDAIARLQASPSLPAIVAMRLIHVPSTALFTETSGALSSLVAGQVPCKVLVPTGALYLIRTKALQEYRSFVPPGSQSIIHGGLSALDIDTTDDWAIAEAAVAQGLVSVPLDNVSR